MELSTEFEKQLVLVAVRGWLSNRNAGHTLPEDTAQRAYEIATNLVKLFRVEK